MSLPPNEAGFRRHSYKCERSQSKRCKCSCGGRWHGCRAATFQLSLDASQGPRHANYRIESATEDAIHIVDVGPHDQHPTVTNDAEWVVESLHRGGKLPRGCVLTYTDSMNRRDQLLHDGAGRFVGFMPGAIAVAQ